MRPQVAQIHLAVTVLSESPRATEQFAAGFSGVVVESLQQGHELMVAYALFFAGTAAVGIPAVILCWMLDRRNRRLKAMAGVT